MTEYDFATAVEHRAGYCSWVVRGPRGWEFWRESDDRSAFPSFYRTKAEATEAKRRSDSAAVAALLDQARRGNEVPLSLAEKIINGDI